MTTLRRRPIYFRTSLRNTVLDVLEYQGDHWIEVDPEEHDEYEWDIHWADVGWIREHLDGFTPLKDHQRINHFQNHYELTRKDLLVKNLKRIKRQLQRSPEPNSRKESEHYDFWAATFVLPTEYGMFLEAFKQTPNGRWIMKPIGKAQDHTWKSEGGVALKTAETYIVQKYIEDPYIIGGKKFDLRLYVLVTSFSPLQFYIYRAGFGRFSNARYSSKKGDMDNLYMHLTNASVQKTAEDYDSSVGCKWLLQHLKLFLVSKHGVEAIEQLFYEIQMVITRSLLSVQQVIIQDKHCFELYGYDVLIDSQLKPWLLEVNASPSLTGDTDQDYALKVNVIQHTLDILDLEGKRLQKRSKDENRDYHIGGFDLIYDNNMPVVYPGYRTYLGCTFDWQSEPTRRTRSKPKDT